MQNLLIKEIRQILEDSKESIGEHQIHKKLSQHSVLLAKTKDKLGLFHRHFLVMNALYQIQAQLWKEGNLDLEISALSIQIIKSKLSNNNENSISTQSSLAAWYLDWNNYDSATEDTVQELLDNFWQLFSRLDKRDAALAELGLDLKADTVAIEYRYKELVQRHHPDKGGDSKTFLRIQSAWENLRP